MAFNNKHYGLDNSDMREWAGSNCAKSFSEELLMLKRQALQKLLKDVKPEHAECYKAYEKVLKLFDEARNLK